MTRFKALMLSNMETGQTVETVQLAEDDLMDGEVLIHVDHSSLHYKDGLAITGRAPVVRRWPMIPGVDLAGTVVSSSSLDFRPGDHVLATGCGLGETHFGGYSQKARVKADWLVPLPGNMTGFEAMAIGTAGFTAMLCVMALEAHHITPDRGPVIVTGAAGGVGSMAISILSRLGYRVVALTGRPQEADYLKALGADEIMDRRELAGKVRPLGPERWAGAIDVAGGPVLAHILSMIRHDGAVAACGLAGGMDLPTSVAPFILRGVSLVGVESVTPLASRRHAAWARLAHDFDHDQLGSMTTTIGFDDLRGAAEEIIAGKTRGRVVVDMAR